MASVTTSTLLGQPSLSSPISESVCVWPMTMTVVLTHRLTACGLRSISRT